MATVDSNIRFTIIAIFRGCSQLLTTMIAISYATPVFLIAIIPLSIAYYFIQVRIFVFYAIFVNELGCIFYFVNILEFEGNEISTRVTFRNKFYCHIVEVLCSNCESTTSPEQCKKFTNLFSFRRIYHWRQFHQSVSSNRGIHAGIR